MDPNVVEDLRKKTVEHLKFVIGLYKIQLEGGKPFLHGHTETATSWHDPVMDHLLKDKTNVDGGF